MLQKIDLNCSVINYERFDTGTIVLWVGVVWGYFMFSLTNFGYSARSIFVFGLNYGMKFVRP